MCLLGATCDIYTGASQRCKVTKNPTNISPNTIIVKEGALITRAQDSATAMDKTGRTIFRGPTIRIVPEKTAPNAAPIPCADAIKES